MRGAEALLTPADPEMQRERTTRHSLRPLTNALFPDTRGTAIPSLVEELIDEFVPLYEPSDSDHDRLFIRGNPTIRKVLGEPWGYWDIPRAYRSIEGLTEFVGEGNLASAVVAHLVAGPDMDVMVQKKQGVTDADVLAELAQWAGRINARFAGLHVDVVPAPLSAWNGDDDPRVYAQIVFSTRKNRREWKNVFRIDLGEAPDKDTAALDGRLSLYMTSFDIASVAGLRKRGDHWYVVIDAWSKRVLRHHPIHVLGSGALPANKSVVVTRLMTQWLFWQRDAAESLRHFLLRQLQPWRPRATHWDLPSLPFGGGDYYWHDVSHENLDEIERREGDVACQAILGLTINPYAWPELAISLGFLRRTRLGRILADANVRIALTRVQADPGQKAMCDEFRLDVVGALSRDYGTFLLSTLKQPYYLGPLQLVRALKRIGALPADTPETIATAIDLVNPVAYLREQRANMGTEGVIFCSGT